MAAAGLLGQQPHHALGGGAAVVADGGDDAGGAQRPHALPQLAEAAVLRVRHLEGGPGNTLIDCAAGALTEADAPAVRSVYIAARTLQRGTDMQTSMLVQRCKQTT